MLLKTEVDEFIGAVAPFKNLYGDYDYYTSLTDFVEGYYKAGQSTKAESLVESIVTQYEARFAMIAQLSQNNKNIFIDRIKGEILDFQELIFRVEYQGATDFAKGLQARFDQSMEQFEIEEEDLENQ